MWTAGRRRVTVSMPELHVSVVLVLTVQRKQRTTDKSHSEESPMLYLYFIKHHMNLTDFFPSLRVWSLVTWHLLQRADPFKG